MLSKFTSIAMGIIEAKETEVFNAEEKVKDIERKLDSGKIDLSEAMSELRSVFTFKLSEDDYRKIEKGVSYNVK